MRVCQVGEIHLYSSINGEGMTHMAEKKKKCNEKIFQVHSNP